MLRRGGQENYEQLGKGPSAARSDRISRKDAARFLPRDASAVLSLYGLGNNNGSEGLNSSSRQASCAVVGNSGVLRLTEFGRSIDSHDIVIRINQAPTRGYGRRVGQRTTFRILNRLWTRTYRNQRGMYKGAQLPRLDDQGSPSATTPPAFLVTRATTQEFLLLRRYLDQEGESEAEAEAEVQADDGYSQAKDESSSSSSSAQPAEDEPASDSDSNVASAYLLTSRAVSMAQAALIEYRRRLCSAGFGPYMGLNAPTSGYAAAFLFRTMCKSLTLYGFGVQGACRASGRSVSECTHPLSLPACLFQG